jgi:hypothetical protein
MTAGAPTDPLSIALPPLAVSSGHCACRPLRLPRLNQPSELIPPSWKSIPNVKGGPGLSTPFFEGHGSGARRMFLGITPPYARPTSPEKEVGIEQADVVVGCRPAGAGTSIALPQHRQKSSSSTEQDSPRTCCRHHHDAQCGRDHSTPRCAEPRFGDRRSPLARVKRALAALHEFQVRPTP